jgi:hypothetical protein
MESSSSLLLLLLLGFSKNWTQRFFGFENFQKSKSKPDSSISKSVIFLGGKKPSKGDNHSIFWQKPPLPLFFQNRVLKFSLFLGQCVITDLSTGCCFNGPVSKRLQLSQYLFRATIATLQKIEKKNTHTHTHTHTQSSKFGKTHDRRSLKTIRYPQNIGIDQLSQKAQ